MAKSKKISKQNSNILKSLTADQALVVLKLLAKKDKNIKNEIEQIAKDYLGQVDAGEIAEEVFMDLESLDVHDVWDNAGSNSYCGYQEPYEVAWDMVEETLELYME